MTRPCRQWLQLFVIAALCLHVLCEFPSTMHRHRSKRTLVYPGPIGKVQAIMGAGFPVDLEDESVIVGIVIKAIYWLPRNATDYTNPNIYYARRKRRDAAENTMMATTSGGASRWDIYKVLEEYARAYGLGGKECLLRTICELSDVPIDKSRGIMEEILHVLFTPLSTPAERENLSAHNDNDYYAAQMLGKKARGQCAKFYKECAKSYVDLFTI